MGKIVAIGGGELKWKETMNIDRFIVSFAGKPSPKALFIPTASGEPQAYMDSFHATYQDDLKCDTDVLRLLENADDEASIKAKILGADIIYVGGGNTKHMMAVWREKQVDKLLHAAYEKGTVLSGLSAGAICWFEFGDSDSDVNPVKGLGLIPAICCPHYNDIKRRPFDLRMQKQTLAGIALEDFSAFVMQDSDYKVISCRSHSNAYLLQNQSGVVHKTTINQEDFLPLSNLLSLPLHKRKDELS